MERTSEHYGNVAMVLHWTVAALIVAAVVIAWVLPGRHAPNRDVVLALHKSVGLLVLVLAAARLLWRRLRPVAPADSLAPWEAWFSAANHALLYGIMIAIPLSGYLFSSAAGQRHHLRHSRGRLGCGQHPLPGLPHRRGRALAGI